MDMDSRQLIDAQFDRAVQIVQSLPKTGPIQTSYEDKLNMYRCVPTSRNESQRDSHRIAACTNKVAFPAFPITRASGIDTSHRSLKFTATVGNVQGPRPSVWDMLGRAKWDAWAKHKDLDPYEAKWLYVEALLKVLRKYPDKTVARDLVRELESYSGDPSNLVMSGLSSRPAGSVSSGSSASGGQPSMSQRPSEYMSAHARAPPMPPPMPAEGEPVTESETDEDTTDEEGDEAADVVPPAITSPQQIPGQLNRPSPPFFTALSDPMAGSLLVPSSPPMPVPATQPLPGFQTQSAFAESAASIPSSAYPTTSVSYPEQILSLTTGTS
ncbi:hypothetical protein NUW54_g3342 [Trametes sanguinea]|uniref:Uncharacterized protein n=1 Tax=Trametes sanguinea TaxID=158606 RepID=A0ACC1Q2C1_9APHY|nr:hypothetical protein NUW54_g3342 [Trametes sanguinea]